ncbi:MAG: FAD-binding oxidoreductase [Candidatus Heimdallarchaeota archaeon]|nr:FAD-binding oxidoreductase [Candidatus Heimdallarchaeota archaeon]
MIEFHDDVRTKFPSYLNDESGIVTSGSADRIYFPKNERELVSVIKLAYDQSIPYTISGGGTGLSGGRVPLEGWIIATDRMTSISDGDSQVWTDRETGAQYQLKLDIVSEKNAFLTVSIAMTIKAIQNYCREVNWFYPPDPTERSCFIGGTVATNASGARTFKFGPTRSWVQSIDVILPSGEYLRLDRAQDNGEITDTEIRIIVEGETFIVHKPNLTVPRVTKNVAGPILTKESHPMDLFIGSGGLLGTIAQVKLKLIRPPKSIFNIFVYCPTKTQLLQVVDACQGNRRTSSFPVPMSVESMDDRAAMIMRKKDPFIPSVAKYIIILEQDCHNEAELDHALEYWANLFDGFGIEDTRVAQSYKEIEFHRSLRHSVPEQINAIVRGNGQAKFGTDCSLPETDFELLHDRATSLGDQFELFQNDRGPLGDQIGYAIWAHAGDAHIHLNLIPRDEAETQKAKELFIEIMEFAVSHNGSIASEHGLGKKTFTGKPAIWYQYGDQGIDELRKMKLSLDPKNLLNRHNLIS